jgi:hypothetical protein
METKVLFEKLLSYMSTDEERTMAYVIEKNDYQEDELKLDGFDFFEDSSGLQSKLQRKSYFTKHTKILKANGLKAVLYSISPTGKGNLEEEFILDVDCPLVVELQNDRLEVFAPVLSKFDDLIEFINDIKKWTIKYHQASAWDDKLTQIISLAVFLYFNNEKKED